MSQVSLAPKSITKGYLVDLNNPLSRLLFQYNPNQIQDERNPTWASIDIPGLSNKRLQFVNGGDRKVSFTLSFHYPDRDVAGVTKRLQWIHSMTYPDYDWKRSYTSAPPIVLFGFGLLYRGLKCVITKSSIKMYDSFDPTTLHPHRADIELELTEFIGGDDSKSKAMVQRGWS